MSMDGNGKKEREGEGVGGRFGPDLLAVYIRPEVPRSGRYAADLLP